MAREMVKRVAFAATAIPVVVAAVWYGDAALALLLALAALLGTRELLGMARQQGLHPLGALATLAGAALPLLAWGLIRNPDLLGLTTGWPYAAAGWIMLILLGTLARVSPQRRPLGSAAVTLLAPLYAGGLLAFAVVIRHASHGPRSLEGAALLVFPLAVTWICDSVAMEVGRRVGGPRLWPVVSPGKTWSGTIGGLLGALASAPLYQVLVFQRMGLDVRPWQALVIAGAIGTIGQAGDLAESLFKREAGVKDSSRLLPGHGGVLDRLDSLYLAVPLTAVLYRGFGVL
jgi:phosphatidate cytidylyltransferase